MQNERAAYATILHRHQFGSNLHDGVGINVHFGHIVDNDGYTQAMFCVVQDALQQRGLSGTEKAREYGNRQAFVVSVFFPLLFFPMCFHFRRTRSIEPEHEGNSYQVDINPFHSCQVCEIRQRFPVEIESEHPLDCCWIKLHPCISSRFKYPFFCFFYSRNCLR